MIGFKALTDFTFDDCVIFLSSHDENDSDWIEITRRYQQLRALLLKKDDDIFRKCNTSLDYQKYLAYFKNLNGASLYQPKHLKDAECYLKNHTVQAPPPPTPAPAPPPPPTPKGFFASFKKRNLFTNIVLCILLCASFLASCHTVLRLLMGFINDWWFIYVPWSLGIIISLIGMVKLMRWKRSGISFLVISAPLLFLPSWVLCGWAIYLILATSSLAGVGILYLVLLLKKNGVSTWVQCKPQPNGIPSLTTDYIIVWWFFIVIFNFYEPSFGEASEINVTDLEDTVVEEEVVWTVDSTIVVEPDCDSVIVDSSAYEVAAYPNSIP